MATAPRPTPSSSAADPLAVRWQLKLYIAGNTPNSSRAVVNLRRVCDAHLAGRYDLEIVDLLQAPALAEREQIVAVPLLVKQLPAPVRRVIGDLSNTEHLLASLDILP